MHIPTVHIVKICKDHKMLKMPQSLRELVESLRYLKNLLENSVKKFLAGIVRDWYFSFIHAAWRILMGSVVVMVKLFEKNMNKLKVGKYLKGRNFRGN